MLKSQKGITLVALVVTVIVLLILAGVSISLVIGNRSTITQTQEGTKNYQLASNAEQKSLEETDNYINDTITNITGITE